MSVTGYDPAADMPGAAIEGFYAPVATAGRWLTDDRVVALLRFGNRTAVDAADPRQISIALPLLGPEELVEVWRTPLASTRGRQGELF